MKPSKAFALAVLLGAALASVTSAASGQSYGPEPQQLTIGAAEFRPEHLFEPFVGPGRVHVAQAILNLRALQRRS